MNAPDDNQQQKVRFSQHDLYQEEIFTDLRTASIHRFTPVKASGEFDKSRKIIFVGHTRILTPRGGSSRPSTQTTTGSSVTPGLASSEILTDTQKAAVSPEAMRVGRSS